MVTFTHSEKGQFKPHVIHIGIIREEVKKPNNSISATKTYNICSIFAQYLLIYDSKTLLTKSHLDLNCSGSKITM